MKFLRYRLRTLLLLAAVVAAVMGWVHRARYQQQAVVQMHRSNPGAALLYDHEVGPRGELTQAPQAVAPGWIRERLGADYAGSIAGADIFYPTDADLACLTRFPKLRRLNLQRAIDLTDQGLEQLASLTHIKLLVLIEADQLTDQSLRTLGQLKQLEKLQFTPGRQMTPSAIEQLKRDLPRCQIDVFDEAPEELAAR